MQTSVYALSLLPLIGLAACQADGFQAEERTGQDIAEDVLTARFDSFTYEGTVPDGLPEPEAGQYRNPVLSGFYPDPSITKGEDAYYLVTSTFAYFPGLPVFRSTDLVNWEQVGNVIDRPGMLDFDGLGLSRGVFAPTIEYEDGTYYVANTCVDCGGNFIVTAEDPAGPWSDPIWLPEVGGIDPSVFFDEDGKVYVINNDAPEGEPRYEGHRAIWIREVDPETFQSISEPQVLLDGGVRPEENPIWIEGPHIYNIDGRYYLWAAEGGTAVNHSQVVLRSDDVLGPYVPYEDNPILTQRHLPADRPNPITSVGHADLVQDDEGGWWATFLGVRPYEGDTYNTGRETFLMPVRWEDGWPVMVQGDEQVPYVADRPALPEGEAPSVPISGSFTLGEDLEGPLEPYWMTVRVPDEDWYAVEDGALVIEARDERLGDKAQPSVLVRRQQHRSAAAQTEMTFTPRDSGDEAGLLVMQSDEYYYALGLGLDEAGEPVVRLRRRAGPGMDERGEVIASTAYEGAPGAPLDLRIAADDGDYDFAFRPAGGEWQVIEEDADGTILSTRVAGGFVGATFGMYAEGGE
ncbi:glycoside hydrolase family 43 protein [Parvularcula oceani]|uniref:glycoside hydrolase family 43 protein n=1 Tax=Parvularcula oceani TaxID=1247963 RepID=UPI0009E063F7|nr:glycoside hydrolase family 43 protein [Parvularcula oceani]